MADAGDPGRYTVRVAESAPGGSGAAASQTRANTFADLEVGPGARRYTVRAAGGSGAAYLQAIGSTDDGVGGASALREEQDVDF